MRSRLARGVGRRVRRAVGGVLRVRRPPEPFSSELRLGVRDQRCLPAERSGLRARVV